MAQLVARLNGIEKVRGSNPLSSTSIKYVEALETLVFQGFLFPVPIMCPRLPMFAYLSLSSLYCLSDNWEYLTADSFA